MALLSAAPLLPMPALYTSAQHTARWTSAVAPQLAVTGSTTLCVCRNRTWHCSGTYAASDGISHRAYTPASAAMSGSWPRRSRILPANAQTSAIGTQASPSTTMARCL
uniref:Uncharacterized protein n=1 Tax=Arundo donax TaxID=35708 RepID=A0A0A9BDL9_ARUDO